MTLDQFWKIISDSREGFDPRHDCERNLATQADCLKQLLMAMPSQEVQGFVATYSHLSLSANRWDLWAAGHIIATWNGGGCGDDGFDDFQRWLIAQGREVFEAALRDPESLVDVASRPGIAGSCMFEEFLYVPDRVLQMRGEEMPDDLGPPVEDWPEEPLGERWEDEDLPGRFPKLWSAFGTGTTGAASNAADNQPMQRRAGILSNIRRWFGRGPGR